MLLEDDIVFLSDAAIILNTTIAALEGVIGNDADLSYLAM